MSKYILCIEWPGGSEKMEIEADTRADAEEQAKDEFFNVCNYGLSEVTDEQ